MPMRLTRTLIGIVHLLADAVIVGTAVKRDGDVRNPVDPARMRRLVAAAHD